MIAGIAGGAALIVLLAIFMYCRSKSNAINKGIDPMVQQGLGAAPPLPHPVVAKKPTVEADGLLAVLEYSKVTPIDLKKEIAYGVELGSGAFGVVMKCKFRNTDCAIKQLHKESKRSTDMLVGLLDEFNVMMQLRHPNVLLTMGIAVDSEDETTGIVMELMQASLFDVIYDPSFRPYANWESSFLSIASDVANGMSFIHFHGLLHRDLKPGNVLIDAQWVAKVADFGNTLDDSNVLYEREQEIAGTPPYMAPEIITSHMYEPPVDVWAFGCIIAHMSSGKIPYQQLNLRDRKAMLDVIRSGEVSPLELLFEAPSIPADILSIAKACCQPDPRGRPDFQSVAERFSKLIDGENDPRPLVRIKNKKVPRISISSPSRDSAADADASSPEAPKPAGFMHSTYRGKFQKRSKDSSAASASTDIESQSSTRDDASEASEQAENSSATSDSQRFLDTFSQTLLRTFTPGKDVATTKKPEDNDDDKV